MGRWGGNPVLRCGEDAQKEGWKEAGGRGWREEPGEKGGQEGMGACPLLRRHAGGQASLRLPSPRGPGHAGRWVS